MEGLREVCGLGVRGKKMNEMFLEEGGGSLFEEVDVRGERSFSGVSDNLGEVSEERRDELIIRYAILTPNIRVDRRRNKPAPRHLLTDRQPSQRFNRNHHLPNLLPHHHALHDLRRDQADVVQLRDGQRTVLGLQGTVGRGGELRRRV